MFCSYCGCELQDDVAYCYKCGKPVKVNDPAAGASAPDQADNPQQVPLDYNVIISCTSGHKKAYTEVQAGGSTVKIFSGESAKLLLPPGNNHLHFFTRRYGLTWVKSKDRYERELYVEQGRVYQIEVTIGQAANRIEIMG